MPEPDYTTPVSEEQEALLDALRPPLHVSFGDSNEWLRARRLLAEFVDRKAERELRITAEMNHESCLQLVEALRDKLDLSNRAVAEMDTLRAKLERAREALEKYSPTSHHDPKGTVGANCPACNQETKNYTAVCTALKEP